MYSAVLWDWNGTLLNDVEENICIVNELLAKRSLPGITKETYKRFFRMPIKDFYKDIGFEKFTGVIIAESNGGFAKAMLEKA